MAADRQSRDGQLHVQHGACVAAAGGGVPGQHRGVAGQLLVQPEAAVSPVQQRVEPLQAAQHHGEQVGAGVTSGQVRALVGKHQGRFAGAQARFEVHRQDDARTQRANHGRAGNTIAAPEALGVAPEPAQAGHEAPLLARKPQRMERRAQQPRTGQQPRPFNRRGRGGRRGIRRSHDQHARVQRQQFRRQPLAGTRPWQRGDRQRQRHQRPRRIGNPRPERVPQRDPQEQHHGNRSRHRQGAIHQPVQQRLNAHRRSPRPGA